MKSGDGLSLILLGLDLILLLSWFAGETSVAGVKLSEQPKNQVKSTCPIFFSLVKKGKHVLRIPKKISEIWISSQKLMLNSAKI